MGVVGEKIMNFFPITIVDDFFEHPDYVLDLAKNADYTPISNTSFKGQTSKLKVHELDYDLFLWTMKRIVGLYWDLNLTKINYLCRMDFHRIEPYHDKDHVLNRGGIHHDEDGIVTAGLVYLNKNICSDSGTSIYDLKKEHQFYSMKDSYLKPLQLHHGGHKVPGFEKLYTEHLSKFTENVRVQNRYNRMLLYSPEEWHAPTSYGDETRYTLRFFINHINSEDQTYPLARTRIKYD